MKINKTRAASVAVAAIMGCGIFAGCGLISRNETANMAQTIATVNIKTSENFKSEFSSLDGAIVDKVIGTESVSKLDLIVAFVSAGYSAMNSYQWSYKETFDALSKSLVQRRIEVQYAKAYFLKNGWTDEDGTSYSYNNLEAFNVAVSNKSGIAYDVAAIEYFLTAEEIAKAKYTTRVMLNNSIDPLEEKQIEAEKDEKKEYDTDVRTTPTGLNTTDGDFYDPDYRVYTGTGKQNAVNGSYEVKKDSNATTRRRAYYELLSNLKSNNLVKDGEDTSDIESLEYFKLEYKGDLESALVQKMTDVFTKQAEGKNTAERLNEKFNSLLANQRAGYVKSYSNLESDLKNVSDSNFVLTSTGNSGDENAYGFVINILLPFSEAQKDELSAVKQDFGDTKGNKFATRAKLLEKVKATDQRGSWFRGETDYSFKADNAAYGYALSGDNRREWLFFKDNFIEESSKYEPLKNYYGKYTYNGTWDETTRKYRPYPITVDGFVGEMNGYLEFVLGAGKVTGAKYGSDDYYTRNYYDANGAVDYDKFVYYEGKVNFEGGFNANEIFVRGSKENKALSVINELSFAYNTDTGGLNSYLGYPVTANKTEFVSEFEYAAQKVVRAGAGNFIIVPSDYGWHVIYCTFSFVNNAAGTGATVNDVGSPFKYEHEKRADKGTFSYLFYEAYKADTASTESTNRRSTVFVTYSDSYKIYEEKYSDLANIGNNN